MPRTAMRFANEHFQGAIPSNRHPRPLRFERLELRQVMAANDVSQVPFWDGETIDSVGGPRLLNRFGGSPINGTRANVFYESMVVHSGKRGYRIDTVGAIPANEFGFIGITLGEYKPLTDYIDTRDIANFSGLQFWLQNGTGSSFEFVFEMKDYRDSLSHRAQFTLPITASSEWTKLDVPLDLTSPGWVVTGTPDFTRTKAFVFVVEAQSNSVSGSIYLDDMSLVERGGSIDPQTADVDSLVDRMAKRQFRGLWSSRDHATGLVPNISSQAVALALNATAALIQMLPTAIEQEWVTQNEAADYISRVTSNLQTVWDKVESSSTGGFVPPRYIDRVSLEPVPGTEESVIDAAFLFLALYRYRALPTTSSQLQAQIGDLLSRFDFAAFSSTAGWKLAYKYTQGDVEAAFTPGTYDGYSGEIYVISLAAHLAVNHHVDITTHWHSSTLREKDHLVDANDEHLVHKQEDLRAPFLQWLFPLFVDVSTRGTESYERDPSLAANPFWNAYKYQREVLDKLAQLGRPTLAQPDAGDDGTGNKYRQFSLYDNFNEPDLVMPWSSSFAFLADRNRAGAALRDLLVRDLHGPLGLSDSAHIPTGASVPDSLTARNDLWNVGLAGMALLQYRFGATQFFTKLPEVSEALDKVLPPAPLVWHNDEFPEDVSGNDHISALDVVLITNELELPTIYDPTTRAFFPWVQPTHKLDTIADGRLTNLDAVTVINYLNLHPLPTSAGEAITPVSSTLAAAETHAEPLEPAVAEKSRPSTIDAALVALGLRSPTQLQPTEAHGADTLSTCAIDFQTSATELLSLQLSQSSATDDLSGTIARLDD